MSQRRPVRPVEVLDQEEARPGLARPLDQPRQDPPPAVRPGGVVHGVVEGAQVRRLGQLEQVVQEHRVLGAERVVARSARHGRGRPAGAARRLAPEHAEDEGPDRAPPGAGPEVEDQPGVAGEAGPARLLLELLDEARLADPGLAADVDGLPSPVRAAGDEGRAEVAQLGCPARERSAAGRRAPDEAAQAPRPHRLGEALHLERVQLVAGEPLAEGAPHRVRDQDLAGPRGPGEAGGEVHRLAGDGVLAVACASRAAGDDLPACDADVHAHLAADLGRDRRHGVADGERGPHRPLRVVAVGHRGAEHGHDAVADVLVDPAAVLLHHAVDAPEEAVEQRVHLLRVELAAQRRVAGEVREEHRHLAPLAGRLGRPTGAARSRPRRAARRSRRAACGGARPPPRRGP